MRFKFYSCLIFCIIFYLNLEFYHSLNVAEDSISDDKNNLNVFAKHKPKKEKSELHRKKSPKQEFSKSEEEFSNMVIKVLKSHIERNGLSTI